MMRRPVDDDGWPYVTTEETWAEAIGALVVGILFGVLFVGLVLTYGAIQP